MSRTSLIALSVLVAGLLISGQYTRMVAKARLSAKFSTCRALEGKIGELRYVNGVFPELATLAAFPYDGNFHAIIALKPGHAQLRPADDPRGPTQAGTVLGYSFGALAPVTPYPAGTLLYSLRRDKQAFVIYYLGERDFKSFVAYVGSREGHASSDSPGEVTFQSERSTF